jgi:hypothetical protein
MTPDPYLDAIGHGNRRIARLRSILGTAERTVERSINLIRRATRQRDRAIDRFRRRNIEEWKREKSCPTK